jgi:hypothetical protein
MDKVASFWIEVGEVCYEARLTRYIPRKDPSRYGDNIDPGQNEVVEFLLFDENGNRDDDVDLTNDEIDRIEIGLIEAMTKY